MLLPASTEPQWLQDPKAKQELHTKVRMSAATTAPMRKMLATNFTSTLHQDTFLDTETLVNLHLCLHESDTMVEMAIDLSHTSKVI